MEVADLAKEEDRVQSSGGDEEEAATKKDVLHKVPFMADLEKPSVASASSSWKEEDDKQEQRIKMAKAEMSQVREENERLKMCLDQMVKDYETLKRKFHEITEHQTQREGKKSTQTSGSTIHDEVEEVEDMVSLTLGRFSTTHQNNNNNNIISSQTKLLLLDHKTGAGGHGSERNKTPSNDQIVQSPADSEPKDREDAGQTWPPSKAQKSLPPPPAGEDEVSQQNPPKKARVCVRARCDTPTMNDGCQWRKYGQKIAKGNPCPRAYYRCTGAPSCPVRKQVQRSIDDISILITTYEGTHNHPLPVSAMAMASTTSAAASMLLSGPSSSTSRPDLGLNPLSSAANHLYLSNNSNNNPKQLYLPNSSLLSSNSLNHPTITLDLTSTSSSSSSSPFHKIPSTYPPKYPFTSLDFGSSQSNLMSWHNGGLIVNNNQPYNQTKNGTVPDLAKQLPLPNNIYQACFEHMNKRSTPLPLSNDIYQACLDHMNKTSTPPPSGSDTIAAATKAITSDPNFQSALVAALSSIIGGGGGGNGGAMSSYVCASSASLLSKTPSGTSSQQGSMALQPPAAPSSLNSKTPSSSPGDSRDNNTK